MMTRFAGLLAALVLAGCATTQTAPTVDVAAPGISAADAAASAPMVVAVAPPVVVDTASRPRPTRSRADDADRTDLWVRVRRGFMMPDLDGPLVLDREQWYASRPDFYGIDMPEREQLLAATKTMEEMAAILEVDSLGFLSVDGLYDALGAGARNDAQPQFTDHYFTGDYPTRLLDRELAQGRNENADRQLSFLVSA